MRPTKEDANNNGDVLVYIRQNDSWSIVPWNLVTEGCHWAKMPATPKKPKDPVLELLDSVEKYRMTAGFTQESDYLRMKLAASDLRDHLESKRKKK